MSVLRKIRLKKTIFFLGTAAFSALWFLIKAFFFILIEVISGGQSDDPVSRDMKSSHPADGVDTFGLDYDPTDTPMDTKDYM
jgi:hypothetical protein